MQIYVYGGVLIVYLILFLAAKRREKREGIPPQAPSASAAQFLYEAYRKARGHRFPELMRENQVRRDLSVLYPGPQLQEQEKSCHIARLRRMLRIFLAGDILAAAVFIASAANARMQTDGSLLREDAGGSDVRVSLRAETDARSGETDPLSEDAELLLHSVRLSPEETDGLEKELSRNLPELVRAGNSDLQHVNSDLMLPAGVEGYPFEIVWESSSYALIDSGGTVSAGSLKQGEQENVILTAVLTYDDGTAAGRRYTEEIPVTVVPVLRSREDEFKEQLRQALEGSEQAVLSQKKVTLPEEIDGVGVTWTEKLPDTSPAVFLLFGFVSCLTVAVSASRLHERIRQRERQIELAYPQILSKLVLFLGAGVSMRGCFAQIGETYREQRIRGYPVHGAYEEILLVLRELESGVPEAEAYEHFSRRCRSRQYTRLCTLLVQNLRKGNRSLLQALQEEADAALEERRNRAREIGEEAETRLLLPMGMMLLITMVMIIVPAYYGFAM